MVSKTFTIQNPQGLHMRPAGMLAAAMGKFESEVTIHFSGNAINAKSLMNIIAAGIKCGSTIDIACEGTDEKEALEKAAELIANGFGE